MIAGVAIAKEKVTYRMSRPNRHHNVIAMMRAQGVSPAYGVQGFYDETGHFLTREQARAHVLEVGQVVDEAKLTHPDMLFSEDLW